MYLYFASMYVCVRMSLELELEAVMSCHVVLRIEPGFSGIEAKALDH